MSLFRVNAGTQVKHDGVLYAAGETFEADLDQVQALSRYVTPVEEKAVESAPNKAQTSSPNKARKAPAKKAPTKK